MLQNMNEIDESSIKTGVRQLIDKIQNNPMSYMDFEKFTKEADTMRAVLESQIESLMFQFKNNREELLSTEEILKESGALQEGSPYARYFSLYDKITENLITERAWHILLRQLYIILSSKLELVLHSVKGTSMTAELIEREQKFIKEYMNENWKRFEDAREKDRDMYNRQIDALVQQNKIKDELLEAIAKTLGIKIDSLVDSLAKVSDTYKTEGKRMFNISDGKMEAYIPKEKSIKRLDITKEEFNQEQTDSQDDEVSETKDDREDSDDNDSYDEKDDSIKILKNYARKHLSEEQLSDILKLKTRRERIRYMKENFIDSGKLSGTICKTLLEKIQYIQPATY